MALPVPTTQEISDNIVAQISAAISQTIPIFPKAFTRVLAKAIAGVFVLLYKYGGFIFLQMFVAYASMAEVTINGKKVRPLVEWGRLIGVGDPLEATRAEMIVDVTVQKETGTLPANSQLLYPSTGVLYVTTAAVALDAQTVQVSIRASSDQNNGGGEGSIGNLDPDDEVFFANPLPNVAAKAVVVSQVVTAADAETVEAYRARILRRFQRKPQGGAYADYQQWSEEVAGILNAYPYTSATPGEIDVYVEATVASSGSADGIPTSPQLAAVLSSINLDQEGLASRRPLNATVNVYPITRSTFNVSISGLVADDETAAETAIESALDEYLRSREPFIVGLSSLPRIDRITAGALAGVADDAAATVGATITTLTMSIGGASIPAYTLGDGANGEKARLGAVTYL